MGHKVSSRVVFSRPVKVAFLPIWRGNPYHDELKKALSSCGVQVEYPESLKIISRDFRRKERANSFDFIHLHARCHISHGRR